MRLILITIWFLAATWLHGQKQQCGLAIDSAKIESSQSFQLLVDSLQLTKLATVNNRRKIPKHIKCILDYWTKGFDIANRNQKFQASDVERWRIKPLPRRQLIYLGLNDHYLLMTYRKGGKALSHYIVIFKFDNKKVQSFWIGYGGEFTSKEEVLGHLEYSQQQTDFAYL